MFFRIGCEIEYNVPEVQYILNDEELLNLQLEREFYLFQVEYNKILKTGKNKKDLERILKEIKTEILQKAKEIYNVLKNKGYTNTIHISESGHVNYGGIIFNGLHLHISVEDVTESDILEKSPHIKAKIVEYKINHSCDLRFLVSHHVWGGHRPSKYNFKKKAKYSPAVATSRGTLEIRALSFFDIYFNSLKNILVNYLWKIINFLVDKDDLNISPDAITAYKVLRSVNSEYIPLWDNDFYSHLYLKTKRRFKVEDRGGEYKVSHKVLIYNGEFKYKWQSYYLSKEEE